MQVLRMCFVCVFENLCRCKKGNRTKTVAVFHVYGDLGAQCFEPDVKNFINVIEVVKISDIFVGELIVSSTFIHCVYVNVILTLRFIDDKMQEKIIFK